MGEGQSDVKLLWSKGVLNLGACPLPGSGRIGRDCFTRGGREELDDGAGEVGSSFAIGLANSFSKKRE